MLRPVELSLPVAPSLLLSNRRNKTPCAPNPGGSLRLGNREYVKRLLHQFVSVLQQKNHVAHLFWPGGRFRKVAREIALVENVLSKIGYRARLSAKIGIWPAFWASNKYVVISRRAEHWEGNALRWAVFLGSKGGLSYVQPI